MHLPINFWEILSPILSWFAATISGGLITYLFSWYKDQDLKNNEAISSSYLICFNLSMQYSELAGLKHEMENRFELLQQLKNEEKKTSIEQLSQNKTKIIQKFKPCSNISINFEHVAKYILPASRKHRGIVETLQDCFISNKKYTDCITKLNTYNQMLQSDDLNPTTLLKFLEKNLPNLTKEINSAMSFNKQTLDSFKPTVKQAFGEEITMKPGYPVKID
jgi:phosphate/sulfate permease